MIEFGVRENAIEFESILQRLKRICRLFSKYDFIYDFRIRFPVNYYWSLIENTIEIKIFCNLRTILIQR